MNERSETRYAILFCRFTCTKICLRVTFMVVIAVHSTSLTLDFDQKFSLNVLTVV